MKEMTLALKSTGFEEGQPSINASSEENMEPSHRRTLP